ncbi:MAG: hypothetical protein EHM12_06690 [Dehalococcoidia bacterium]|nr:MAG: hypothetical protein EHM12_06690 [Dehalococcoidia bacterium]
MKVTINIPDSHNLDSHEIELVINSRDLKVNTKIRKRELLAIWDALNTTFNLPHNGLTELEITCNAKIKQESGG